MTADSRNNPPARAPSWNQVPQYNSGNPLSWFQDLKKSCGMNPWGKLMCIVDGRGAPERGWRGTGAHVDTGPGQGAPPRGFCWPWILSGTRGGLRKFRRSWMCVCVHTCAWQGKGEQQCLWAGSSGVCDQGVGRFGFSWSLFLWLAGDHLLTVPFHGLFSAFIPDIPASSHKGSSPIGLGLP